MRYLVTGGTGFIGSAIVKSLVKLGNKVTVIDNNYRGKQSRFASDLDFNFIEGDVRNLEEMEDACRSAEVLIHAAFINGTKRFYEQPYQVVDVGINGVINLIKSIDHSSIKRIILISSSEVYQSPSIVPTPENIPLVIPDLSNPRYSYGGSKIASELALYHYCKFKDLDLQIIRPHNIYGSDMGEEHVIPEIALKIQNAIKTNKQIIDLQGSGDESRSFCYIEDFIQGFDLVSNLPFNNCQEVFNIGTDEEVKISKLVELMTNKFSINLDYNYLPPPEGGTLRRCPDISKLKSIGFASQYDLDSGLNLYLDWFKKVNSNKDTANCGDS